MPDGMWARAAQKQKRGSSLLARSVALCMAGAFSAQALAGDYSSITVFGDSLSDSGHYAAQGWFTRQVFCGSRNPDCRFTTNPDEVWSQRLAEKLDLELTTKTADGGNNYAIGGARAGETASHAGGLINILPVSSQVDEYLSNNRVDPTGLYVLWAGANDLFEAGTQLAAGNRAGAQSAVLESVEAMGGMLERLQEAGAKYILMPNIPDVGLTPDYVNTANQAQATSAAASYNQMLYGRARATGANVIPLDTFGLLQQVVANPSAYGFDNVTDRACTPRSSILTSQTLGSCTASTLTADAQAGVRYFFADGVHPTGRAHEAIAEYAQSVLAAPAHMEVLPYALTRSQLATLNKIGAYIDGDQDTPYRVWAFGAADDASGAGFADRSATTMAVGVDVKGQAKNRAGFYFSHQNQDLVRSQNAQVDAKAVGAGAYYRAQIGEALSVRVGAGLEKLDLNADRLVRIADWQMNHQSSGKGKRAYAYARVAYNARVGQNAFAPYGEFVASRLNVGEFKEQAQSATAMAFDEQKYKSAHAKIGVNWGRDLSVLGGVRTTADVYYRARLSDNKSAVTSRLVSVDGVRFSVPSAFDDDGKAFGLSLGVGKDFGALAAQVGAHYERADGDDALGFSVGLSKAF